MIEDPDDPQMQCALKDMVAMVNARIVGRQLDGSDRKILDDLETLIFDHKARWKARGVAFPDMTALIVPRLGYVKLMRADLNQKSIETEIVNMAKDVVALDGITREEIATAIRYAWPGYRPGNLQ